LLPALKTGQRGLSPRPTGYDLDLRIARGNAAPERSKALDASIEILDLRHFGAPALHAVMEAEGALWLQRLHWDFRNSAKLLTQYLDNHSLTGLAALQAGEIAGYAFCVYEDTKAVIGDIFAVDAAPNGAPHSGEAAAVIETTLMRHLFEILLNSPQVDRVESQLLLQPSGFQARAYREAGFVLFPRLFMVQSLHGRWSEPQIRLPRELEMRPWRDDDLTPAARLICAAYQNHPDSIINDQYRSVHGSMRFLNNIVRYAGCGAFSAQVSHVVVDRRNKELAALVLGSRVSPESGHITQLCVHPSFRRHGLARMLLAVASHRFLRQGAGEISLTVTEANTEAITLYQSEGYLRTHSFDANVWLRHGSASGFSQIVA
jgi:ribosomal protein S18 acetylase RimI-like enzyme